MSQFRLVLLLSLVAAAGCYKEAPDSTLPEPEYFAGPPGGAMDPVPSYQQPAEPGEELGAIDGRAGEEAPLAEAPPELDGSEPLGPGQGDVAQAPVEGQAPYGDPTATVTDVEIETTLDGYGQWIETDEYGSVWRPDATVVGLDFTPYETGGTWAYTDAGWAFSCDHSWGWLPFHYGQWAWFNDYWAWVPGYEWRPAWVEWRHGGGVVGWRPLRPQIRDHRHREHRFGSGTLVRDHRRSRQYDAHWRFAAASDLGRPRIRSHLHGNLAEGLRVTSTVSAPPVRGRTTLPRSELMRNRFATGQPARFGGRVRDHRDARGYPPAQGIRSTRPDAYGPRSAPPVRTYQPPSGRIDRPPGRTYEPPVRSAPPMQGAPPVRADRPPVRTYEPPVRSAPPMQGAPPVRTYQPPVRTYQPPVRTYQPPVRTYQPPVRTYQPPGRGAPPVQSAPPVRTYQPPVRTYQPPVHGAPPVQSAPPVRTYTPPARTYAPAPSAPPARTYAPPASPPPRSHSNSSSSSSSNSSSSHSSSHGRHR